MFDVFLGFRIRIGRIAFFLWGFGLSFAIAIVAFAVFRLLIEAKAFGAGTNTFIGAIVVCCLIAMWGICNLYAMRVRDIGWNPALVIPLWVLLGAIDCMISYLFPEFAAEDRPTGTWVGRIANTLFWLTLQFWPGTPGGYVDTPEVTNDAPVLSQRETSSIRAGVAVPPSRFDPPVRRTSFGRLSR